MCQGLRSCSKELKGVPGGFTPEEFSKDFRSVSADFSCVPVFFKNFRSVPGDFLGLKQIRVILGGFEDVPGVTEVFRSVPGVYCLFHSVPSVLQDISGSFGRNQDVP